MDKRELEVAYRESTFAAKLPDGELCIRIGERHPRLDALLKKQHAGTWAYISACNPGAVHCPPEENEKRHAALTRVLKPKGYRILQGERRRDTPGWETEPSVLVIDIEHESAKRLGEDFGQYAIVIGQHGRFAKLLWSQLACDAEDALPPWEMENGYSYVDTKTAHRFLNEQGISDAKNLNVFVESVHLAHASPKRLVYICWGKVGTCEFLEQSLSVHVGRDGHGRACADTYQVVFEPSEYPDPSDAPACDLETALYVVTGGDGVFLTADCISEEAIEEIREDLQKL
jgi:Protein of unknown function (DUF3293)